MILPSNITEVGQHNYVQEVELSDKPVLMLVYAKTCAPCVNFTPTFFKIAETHTSHFKFVLLDGNRHGELAEDICGKAYPSTAIFSGPKQIAVMRGACAMEYYLDFINRNLAQLKRKK